MAALKNLAAPKNKVVRDQQLDSIAALDLVPGDIVEVAAGDNVPADVRLLTAVELRIEDAALTGESVAVEKNAELVLPDSIPIADRQHIAYTSTLMVNGHGRGVVLATGMSTEIGPITRPIFQATDLPASSWGLVIALALVPVTIIELVKLGYRFSESSNTPHSEGDVHTIRQE